MVHQRRMIRIQLAGMCVVVHASVEHMLEMLLMECIRIQQCLGTCNSFLCWWRLTWARSSAKALKKNIGLANVIEIFGWAKTSVAQRSWKEKHAAKSQPNLLLSLPLLCNSWTKPVQVDQQWPIWAQVSASAPIAGTVCAFANIYSCRGGRVTHGKRFGSVLSSKKHIPVFVSLCAWCQSVLAPIEENQCWPHYYGKSRWPAVDDRQRLYNKNKR